MSGALVWFKRHLRTADHRPLAEAAHCDAALALVIIEPAWLTSPECHPRHVAWLLQCLAPLRDALAARGLPLQVRTGEAVEVLAALRREFAFTHLFSHEETGPAWSYARDLAVARWCRAEGVAWTEWPQTGVVRRLKDRRGWAGHWQASMDAPCVPGPSGWRAPPGMQPSALPTLQALGLPPTPTPAALPPAGEAAAQAVLASFVGGRALGYRQHISSPLTAEAGCSRLSPHLAFGTLSMRTVHQPKFVTTPLVFAARSLSDLTCCPLAKLGYNRDGKSGLLQVNYGLLTDARGCPVAVSVYEGNVSDAKTLMPEVKRLREKFGIERFVLVGDRGMISSKAIDELRQTDGVGWITALKSVSIRALMEQGQLQLGLFDERNLVEISSPEYPGERLVACRNPELAKLRAHKRAELLAATEASLDKIKARVDKGKLCGSDEIGVRVGKVINRYKMSKHFELSITASTFTFARKLDAITAEAALDGIYIVRTSVPATQMDAPTCVRNYKSLAQVERAFRSPKSSAPSARSRRWT